MILKQSTTYTRMFMMVQSADHVSGLTGASPAVKISKAGAAGAASANSPATEVDSTNLPGVYKIALTAADTNTLGDLAFDCTAASGDHTTFIDQVQAQIFTDLLLDSNGRAKISSSYQINTATTLPFTMTVGDPPVATAGLTVTAQKNFGSGFTPIGGTITDLGSGCYQASLIASDTNGAVVLYRFTAATANDLEITIYTQP